MDDTRLRELMQAPEGENLELKQALRNGEGLRVMTLTEIEAIRNEELRQPDALAEGGRPCQRFSRFATVGARGCLHLAHLRASPSFFVTP